MHVSWRVSFSFAYRLVCHAHLLLVIQQLTVEWAGQQVAIFLNYTTAGSTFVYGYLADVSCANVSCA